MATSVAVVGDGASNRRNTSALISDFVDGFAAETTFVIPVTAPWFSDAVRHVADWVYEHQSTFTSLVFLADGHDIVDLADYDGIPITEVDDMLDALAESEQVIVSWSDADYLENWVEGVLKAGKAVLDLTDGLYPIEYTPDESDDAPVVVDDEPTPEPVEPEPVEETKPDKPAPKPRSRAARNATKAQEKAEEAPAAEETIPLAKEPQKGTWPPQQGDEINTPAFFEAMIAEVERRVVERLRNALG